MKDLFVKDIQDREDLLFTSVDFEVREIKEMLGIREDFDALFLKIEEGEFVEVYGMHGIIPDLNRAVYRVV